MAMLAGDTVPFSEHGLDDGPAEALLDSAAGENPVAFPVAIVTQPHVSPLWSPAAGSIFSQHCQQLFNTLPYSFEADQTVHDYFHTLSPQQPLDFLSGRPRPRLCPRGHNHSPWPRQGRVAIEKCERRCDFCGTELRTAAALRKHVLGHKNKDGLDIIVASSTSGRYRRGLLESSPSNLPAVPGSLFRKGADDLGMMQIDQGQLLPAHDIPAFFNPDDLMDIDMQSTSGEEGSGPGDPAATSSVTMGAMPRPGLPVQTYHSDGTPSPCQDEEAIASILATSTRLEARLNELRTWLSSSAASEQSHGPCDCSSLREGVNSHMSQISSLVEQIQREAVDLKHRSQAGKRHRETSADAAQQRQDTAVDLKVQGRMGQESCDNSKAALRLHPMMYEILLEFITRSSNISATCTTFSPSWIGCDALILEVRMGMDTTRWLIELALVDMMLHLHLITSVGKYGNQLLAMSLGSWTSRRRNWAVESCRKRTIVCLLKLSEECN